MIKKHLSIFMLMARSSIYKVFGVITLMALSEFWILFSLTKQHLTFDTVIPQSRIPLLFGSAFLLITFLIVSVGWEGSGKQGYTLSRLSVSQKTIFFWQSLYNIICFLLLWMVQVLIVIVFYYLFNQWTTTGHMNMHVFFLYFHQSKFLHALMPFDDIALWIRNIICVISLGLCTAYIPCSQRNKKPYLHLTIYIIYAMISFSRQIADWNLILDLPFGLCTLIGIAHDILRKESAYED